MENNNEVYDSEGNLLDGVSIDEDELQKIVDVAYRIGFSEGASYMIARDFKDTPESSGYYRKLLLRRMNARLTAVEEVNNKEKH